MFDRMVIKVVPRGRRFPAQVRFWMNGEDVVEAAVGPDGRGPYAADVLPPGVPSPLRATGEARRLVLGEPECTGGCCGFLSVVVQRHGEIVEWSDWQLPWEDGGMPYPPPELHFDAVQYDAELARAETVLWWQADA